MKRYILIALLGAIFQGKTFSWDYPLEVGVTFVWFDYESGNTNDALNIRIDKTHDVITPEWDYPGGWNYPYANIKSQSNRKVKTRFWHLHDDITSIHIYANDYYGEGVGPLPEMNVPFTLVTGGGASDLMTFTSTGYVNYAVRRYTSAKYQWRATKVNGVTLPSYVQFTQTTHVHYVTLATPQSPMAEPWTDVLTYSCNWASGRTTESAVVSKITEKAYIVLGNTHEYFGGDSHTPTTTFDLTDFFDEDWADCRDMSAVVQVFTNAVGGSSIQVRKINGQFVYNPILPIGHSTWVTGAWNFHQVGYLSNVYDACLKLNQSDPRIPINESINGS